MKKKTVSKIPEFKTIEELANFWDTHSFTDFEDEFEEVEVIWDLKKPREETLILRIQKELKDHLKKIAEKKGLNVSTLARMWIMEKLQASR